MGIIVQKCDCRPFLNGARNYLTMLVCWIEALADRVRTPLCASNWRNGYHCSCLSSHGVKKMTVSIALRHCPLYSLALYLLIILVHLHLMATLGTPIWYVHSYSYSRSETAVIFMWQAGLQILLTRPPHCHYFFSINAAEDTSPPACTYF